MQLIKPDININFIGKNKIAVIVSILLILIGIGSLIIKGGPSYGIDFAGGTLVQVKFEQATTAGEIRSALGKLDLRGLTVQQFGDEAYEYLVRAQETTSELEGLSRRIGAALEAQYGAGQFEIRRTEMVGPQVGRDLREKAGMAILYAMIGIIIYITWRFELRYAVAAVVALAHDVLITLGVFSLFNRDIDLPIIAAFLAIIGYSLNDTIIIFDRIRENLGKHSRDGFAAVVNRSINETLARTLMTSGTTLLVVLALFFLGGGVIHDFALALLVGIVVGTYSTIFVACAIILYWEKHRPAKLATRSAQGGSA